MKQYHEDMKEVRRNVRRVWRARPSFIIAMIFICAVLSFPFSPVSYFLVAAPNRSDSAAVSTATRAGRLAVFDDVWQTVSDHYYDANFHGVDWLVQRSVFRRQAAEAGSPQELYAALRRMLGSLRDAHTRVYAPEEKSDWQHPRFVSIGVSLREVEGQPIVVAVDAGSEPERAGVRPGDLIESIDGEPASSVLQRRLREQMGSSTPQAARSRAVALLLEGAPNSNVAVVWRTSNNKAKSASFRRQWRQRNFVLQIGNRRGNHAVIEIDVFTWAIVRDFRRTLKEKLRHVRGMVLDLRNNGGGDAEAMAGIASYFLPPATRLGEFTNRSGQLALSLETEGLPLPAIDRVTGIDVPVVILISERTSSAAEILAAAMQEAHRATVIGGETCGCVLAIRTQHALPDGGELDVSELDYRTAKGVRLEGRGIVPDESASLLRRDLYSGHDRAMEFALARFKDLGANLEIRSTDAPSPRTITSVPALSAPPRANLARRRKFH